VSSVRSIERSEIEVETTVRGSRVVVRLPGIDHRYRVEPDGDPEHQS
jgi:hypothetical protein